MNPNFVQGGSKLERARDLFEQALEKCPPKSCKSIFLMYTQLEEEHGLAKRAMTIYDRATQVVENEDKFEVGCFLSIFNDIERCLTYVWRLFQDVHRLYRQGSRKLWSHRDASYIRARLGDSARPTNSQDVSSLRRPGTQAWGDRPSTCYICARLSVLRPADEPGILGRMALLRNRHRFRRHVPRDVAHQAQCAGSIQHGGELSCRTGARGEPRRGEERRRGGCVG